MFIVSLRLKKRIINITCVDFGRRIKYVLLCLTIDRQFLIDNNSALGHFIIISIFL